MNDENKVIARSKKFTYNFFWNNSKLWGAILFLLGLTPFYEVVKPFLSDDFPFFMISVIIAIVSYFIYNNSRRKENITPFGKGNNFVGIYSIDDLNGKDSKYYNETLLSRVREVEYIQAELNDIFSQDLEKQSICIIGESGSGKSTIINRLENEISDTDIIDCTDRYQDLIRFILKKFKKETLEDLHYELENSTCKRLFIFDQFERFFYLDYSDQLELKRKIFNKLNHKNLACIFILRSDYFSEFIYNFNINNISENIIYPSGILLNSLGKERISNNYLLFCKNPVDIDFPVSQDYKQKTIIENRNNDICRLCKLTFGNFSNSVYNRYRNSKLIEQQIFLNLLEEKYKTTYFPLFFEKNSDRDLIIEYFDRQLCSTGKYSTAARILYLLSMGRTFDINYSLQQIKEALLVSKDLDISDLNVILKKLCKLHLIKLVQRNSTEYYEVVHDYIAEKFIEYAELNLHEYLKRTLDDYRVNFKSKEYTNTVHKCLEIKRKKNTFENFSLFLVVIIIASCSLYQHKFYNDNYNFLVNLPLYLSSYYGYCIYTNIFKLYTGRGYKLLKFFYIIMAFCIVCARIFSKFWIFFVGLGTILIGISFFIIYSNDKISKVAKKFYKDFSGKVTATGAVIFAMALLLYITKANFYIGFILIIAELIYAYIAQLSEEYYYYCIGLMNSR